MKKNIGILINYFEPNGALATGRYLEIEDQLCVDVMGELAHEFFAVVINENQHTIRIPVENIIGLAEVMK